MRTIITLLSTLLVATTVSAADTPEGAFRAFMDECKDGDVQQAIQKYGVDERNSRSFAVLNVPGDLTYEIKDTESKESKKEATISAVIEYTRITEKAEGGTDKARTAGKLASGNVLGAAVGVGKNEVGDGLDRFGTKEKVKMRTLDGKWKVVVTDRLYDILTGQ